MRIMKEEEDKREKEVNKKEDKPKQRKNTKTGKELMKKLKAKIDQLNLKCTLREVIVFDDYKKICSSCKNLTKDVKVDCKSCVCNNFYSFDQFFLKFIIGFPEIERLYQSYNLKDMFEELEISCELQEKLQLLVDEKNKEKLVQLCRHVNSNNNNTQVTGIVTGTVTVTGTYI